MSKSFSCVAALASGNVQMVFAFSTTLLNDAAGRLDAVVVGNFVSQPEGDFMVRPEIKRAEHLKDKQIAIQTIGRGGWANNMLALDYLNLDPDREQIHFDILGDQPFTVPI